MSAITHQGNSPSWWRPRPLALAWTSPTNIRLVIHAGLPLGMSDYTQQVGRGGRNGKKTCCILLYALGDEQRALRILADATGGVSSAKRHEVAALVDAIRSPDCLWSSICRYYGERTETTCGHCTHCRRRKHTA